MKKTILKYVILLSLLLCFLPTGTYADSTLSGSFTVGGNPIIDLAVSNPTYTTLTLTWTSPQSTLGWGPATEYDIRYSLSPIDTEAAWQAATQVAVPPLPKPPGSPETFIAMGLNPCTTYYFAIKAADGNGTWTPLSNSPSGKTLCYSGGGGGGGGGGLPPGYAACPITVAADMQGNITTVRATKDGVLCATCVAKDASDKHTLQLDEGTKVISADKTVPLILRFQETSESPLTPENTVIVGAVYKINAYSATPPTTPSPVTILPPARLILTYEPDELPENTSEVFIANYDTEEGWLALEPVPGVAAEAGVAHAMLGHFSIFAVLAVVTEPATAKFEVSNLTVSPSQAQPNQEVTVNLNVTNTGEKSGDCNLELKVDGKVNSTTQLTIAPGTTQMVIFTVTEDTAGKYRVEVAGLNGEFEVTEPAKTSQINWWFIGGITGAILVLAVWSIIGWRWSRGRKKAAVASADTSTDTSTK
ncbi:CARDB domain-containing protein [Chloroflexota bacterium]